MNILITVSTYYPKKDGVQNVTQYMAEGLAKKGHNVKVVTSNRGVNIPFEEHNLVKIQRINLYTRFGLYFGSKKEYVKLIDEEASKADVIINVCTQNAFTDLILNRLGKYSCRKILYLHGMFNFKFSIVDFSGLETFCNKIWKELRWFFYYLNNGKNFKEYDVVTQLHDKDYANLFFKNKYNIESTIIGNAISEDFLSVRNEINFEKPFEKYVIYVANYGDLKNQKLAIKQFLNSNISSNIGLVLIGSSENKYYKSLKKLESNIRKKMKIAKNHKPILMLSNVDRKYISSYVSNAYLTIMTSKKEVFPMSIVESISVGVPFICTNVGIVKYFLGGIVVNKNDDFKFWIEYLCGNHKMRELLSNVCVRFYKDNFSIEDKINILENKLKVKE